MLGRFFFIALLLIGAAAVALWATRSGYNVAGSTEGGTVTCTYWLGFGVQRVRHEVGTGTDAAAFECPLLLRDVVP